MPIWLNPPAKVKRQKIINTIITNIADTSNIKDFGYDVDIYDFFRSIDQQLQTHTISPNNYRVEIIGTEATLYRDNGTQLANWNDLLEVLSPQGSTGTINEEIDIDDIPLTAGSSIQLNLSNDVSATDMLVTGSVVRNTVDPAKLIFTLDQDTLPANTLPALTRIVDPEKNAPGDGNLAPAIAGQRYLLTSETQIPIWGIHAEANDIIEYNGAEWSIAFDSNSQADSTQYVENSFTNKQYKWDNAQWTSTHEGIYNPGYWILNV